MEKERDYNVQDEPYYRYKNTHIILYVNNIEVKYSPKSYGICFKLYRFWESFHTILLTCFITFL